MSIVLALLLAAQPPPATAPSPAAPPAAAPATPPAAAPSAPPQATPLAARVVTLDEAVRTARQNQPQLQQARANTEASSARADQARSVLLPQLNASASYLRRTANPVPNSIPGLQVAARPESWTTYPLWSFGGTLSQTLFDFGSFQHWRASGAAAESQRETELATQSQVVLGVRTAYFNARAAKDLVGVARETLANQEAHLRQIQGFVEVGTRPEIDLAQARTDRANAQVQLINAENGYETAKAQLNQAMGVEASTGYDVADDTLPPVPGEDQSLDTLLAEAVRDRPDLASIGLQVRSQELTLSSTKAGYLPTLGVSTGITEAGPDLGSTVWNWNAQATLTWNLFGGGLTRAQVQEAQANLDSLHAQGAAVRQQVRLDVDQARLAVRAAKTALGAAGEALTNARERLRLAEGRYQTGAGSVIELGDAQVALTAAAGQRVQAEYNLSTSRAQLLRALGRDSA